MSPRFRMRSDQGMALGLPRILAWSDFHTCPLATRAISLMAIGTPSAVNGSSAFYRSM